MPTKRAFIALFLSMAMGVNTMPPVAAHMPQPSLLSMDVAWETQAIPARSAIAFEGALEAVRHNAFVRRMARFSSTAAPADILGPLVHPQRFQSDWVQYVYFFVISLLEEAVFRVEAIHHLRDLIPQYHIGLVAGLTVSLAGYFF